MQLRPKNSYLILNEVLVRNRKNNITPRGLVTTQIVVPCELKADLFPNAHDIPAIARLDTGTQKTLND